VDLGEPISFKAYQRGACPEAFIGYLLASGSPIDTPALQD